jgi:predicted esterase
VVNYQNASFQFKGRYAVLGNLDKSTKKVLIVLHGQGHLANYFVQKFKFLKAKGITIIAPEGIHQYYLEGFAGRVGASWMTSENREVAIENYINFLNAVYNEIVSKTSSKLKTHVLGFSQGAATVSRWVEQSSFEFEQLILWGGAIPPDLEPELIYKRLRGKQFYQIIGSDDPYITSEYFEQMKSLIKKYKLSPTFKKYTGGHDLDKTTLEELFSRV